MERNSWISRTRASTTYPMAQTQEKQYRAAWTQGAMATSQRYR